MTRLIFILPVLLIFFSCNKEGKVIESATSGHLKAAYDEAFNNLVSEEIDVFQYLYKNASITGTIAPQEISHHLLLLDSVKFIFSSRTLNVHEIKYLKNKNVYPKIYEFARSSIVILVNNSNPDSVYTIFDLKNKILKDKNLVLVTDHGKSATLYSFMELLGLKGLKTGNIFSADSLMGVVNYVSENKSAVGIIPGTWISDQESPAALNMRKKVRIAGISSNDKQYFKPFQSEIADSLYPLSTKIYIISRESKMGISNGFASFLLAEKGQRIVLKSGLVPARFPGREVVLTKKDITR